MFLTSYTRLVTTVWADEAISRRLNADPKSVANEFGLGIPLDAEVKLLRVSSVPSEQHQPNVDVQVQLWDDARRSGVYELHVPEVPLLETEELSDEDLEGIAGGAINISIGNCCCTPCCTCCYG